MRARQNIVPALSAVCALWAAQPAHAGSHTWKVNEVFSNASGTIQFIELKECCGGNGETGVNGHNLTSNTRSFLIPGPALPATTGLKTLLFATPAYAALPGVPTPDYIFPANMVPFFSPSGDSISYAPWDTLTFGSGVLPTDCTYSLGPGLTVNRSTPKNYAGVTREVFNCSCPGDAVPVGGNAAVDVDDLLEVITHWGRCLASPCSGQLVPPYNTVNVDDLLAVITQWGPCH